MEKENKREGGGRVEKGLIMGLLFFLLDKPATNFNMVKRGSVKAN